MQAVLSFLTRLQSIRLPRVRGCYPACPFLWVAVRFLTGVMFVPRKHQCGPCFLANPTKMNVQLLWAEKRLR